ncbi:hypothetical protein LRAMOSA10941 [Lichtheimia ramosa]|uniref:F-box domain-containing protein n=1 Tax=Lichtheimia ramosa TaxID=688394 RepID=A0A077WPT7_9FUNG|nr:hypothetical protein LRAMOSA10941 [Lichtheimia ramosa]
MSWHLGMNTPTPTSPNDLHGSNKRIDFISELPLDVVVYNIVPRILSGGPIALRLDIPNSYLDVCRTWCERFMVVAGNMRCRIRRLFSLSKQQEMRLKAAGPYVRRLDVIAISDQSINQLAGTVKFTCLSELTISMNGSQTAYHHFFSTLPNLTYLKITYNSPAYEPFQVYDILDQCTKLTRLDLTLDDNTTMVTSNDNQHPMYHNLVHLQAIRGETGTDTMYPDHIYSRGIYWEKSECDMFIPLLRHLHNLHTLQLSHPPSEAALTTIHQHCPQLQQLILSQYHARAVTGIVQQQQQQQQGLRLLRIHHISFEGDYLTKLITQYHSTLESIVFHVHLDIPVPFNENLVFELKQLRSFQYNSRYYLPFIDWVINHAPNLESIQLPSDMQHTDNLRTLMHRPLGRIELECASRHQPDHWQYLQHHIQLGNESRLEEIKCDISLIQNGSWMYLIPQLNHLKSLELVFQFDEMYLFSCLDSSIDPSQKPEVTGDMDQTVVK